MPPDSFRFRWCTGVANDYDTKVFYADEYNEAMTARFGPGVHPNRWHAASWCQDPEARRGIATMSFFRDSLVYGAYGGNYREATYEAADEPTPDPPDTSPRFTGAVADQDYAVGEPIGTLVLPEATGGNGTLAYTLVPVVAGLTFDPITRIVGGTPTATAEGTHAMTYRVEDADGNEATLRFEVRVAPAPVADRCPGVTDQDFQDWIDLPEPKPEPPPGWNGPWPGTIQVAAHCAQACAYAHFGHPEENVRATCGILFAFYPQVHDGPLPRGYCPVCEPYRPTGSAAAPVDGLFEQTDQADQ